MKDEDYPALYRAGDRLASKAQTHFFKVLFLNLFLLVIAATLSVFDLPLVEIAYAQATVLLLSLGCALYLGFARPERIWYGGRALAESIKTVTWRYMMRAEPYNVPDAQARLAFIEVLAKLRGSNTEISKKLLDESMSYQVTNFMVSTRALSFSKRKEFYLQGRICDQLNWYQGKARANDRAATIFFVVLCAANIIAIGLALSRIKYSDEQFWPTDIAIAIAGALLAWTQAKRYRELSASYALTAQEISLIREQLFNVSGDAKFSHFVGDAENAFSREHTQWVARRD
ncbi:DUF4231 domain-containing protein [Pseudoduganella sp. GCM10020061]|uniref:DUF4231 domain-containing protein n=1 Tax=Pseudoduganella sp. GCM10020061 TaxID=3317345 RepID=UPI0036271271